MEMKAEHDLIYLHTHIIKGCLKRILRVDLTHERVCKKRVSWAETKQVKPILREEWDSGQ